MKRNRILKVVDMKLKRKHQEKDHKEDENRSLKISKRRKNRKEREQQ
jgi:hypothetical protein